MRPVSMIPAQSPTAASALTLVQTLQRRLVGAMEQVAREAGDPQSFAPVQWLRDSGHHGGGERWGTGDTAVFDRASVNISQVHYDDEPDKRLASATALSAIIHPAHPQAPSMHVHVSWTQMRDGHGYWRVMADLNPSIPREHDIARFVAALREAAPAHYEAAAGQGARYFFIPALGRHRGVAHFYLEAYATQDHEADAVLAERVIEAAIDTYAAIVADALRGRGPASPDERAQQLAYHTLYLFQVLTLDRGTTSGLLIHDQNDVGILGSLPSHVDRELLASWAAKVPAAQRPLVEAIVAELPPGERVPVDDACKARLAAAMRVFYRAHPEAIELQASGDVVPPTVANHR